MFFLEAIFLQKVAYLPKFVSKYNSYFLFCLKIGRRKTQRRCSIPKTIWYSKNVKTKICVWLVEKRRVKKIVCGKAIFFAQIVEFFWLFDYF